MKRGLKTGEEDGVIYGVKRSSRMRSASEGEEAVVGDSKKGCCRAAIGSEAGLKWLGDRYGSREFVRVLLKQQRTGLSLQVRLKTDNDSTTLPPPLPLKSNIPPPPFDLDCEKRTMQ